MSPIRPENRDRYPDDWPEISRRIRFDRAQGRCECDGRCGHDHGGRCRAWHGETSPVNERTTIILTTAHLDNTPENCADENLMAMCQRCHLSYDRALHAENARRTRDARTGQQRMALGGAA